MPAIGLIHGGKRRFGVRKPHQVAAQWRGRRRNDALRSRPDDSSRSLPAVPEAMKGDGLADTPEKHAKRPAA